MYSWVWVTSLVITRRVNFKHLFFTAVLWFIVGYLWLFNNRLLNWTQKEKRLTISCFRNSILPSSLFKSAELLHRLQFVKCVDFSRSSWHFDPTSERMRLSGTFRPSFVSMSFKSGKTLLSSSIVDFFLLYNWRCSQWLVGETRASYVTSEKLQQARALNNFIQPAQGMNCRAQNTSRWTHQ